MVEHKGQAETFSMNGWNSWLFQNMYQPGSMDRIFPPKQRCSPNIPFYSPEKTKTKTIVEKMQPTPNLVEVNSKDQGEGECILDSHRQFKNLKYLITWPRFILSTPHGWVQFWEICIKGCISFFKISEQNLKILKKKKRRVKGDSAFQNGSPMLLWKEHQPNKRYLGS